jgi:hypothetical protein
MGLLMAGSREIAPRHGLIRGARGSSELKSFCSPQYSGGVDPSRKRGGGALSAYQEVKKYRAEILQFFVLTQH